jgi:hypothetical protein
MVIVVDFVVFLFKGVYAHEIGVILLKNIVAIEGFCLEVKGV